MKVHDSALTHGVLPENAVHAASRALLNRALDEDNLSRQLRLRFDTRGRLLETAVLAFDSGNGLAIHAMNAMPQRCDLLP